MGEAAAGEAFAEGAGGARGKVVTTMKTYCESGTFQRGQEAVSGDASIAMFGNTELRQ